MSSRKEHCRRSLEVFGKDYNDVHAWIDGCANAGKGFMDMNHRWKRHHREGVEEVRKMYGDEAAMAAEQHITDDFGCVPTKADVVAEFGTSQKLVKWSNLFGR